MGVWNSSEKSPSEKILLLTNGGKDVFRKFLGDNVDSTKVFNNPFRQDSRPSCRLYWQERPSGSRYVLYDFGDPSWTGDVFNFVAKLGNMNLRSEFAKVMHAIDNEFCLGVYQDNKVKFEQKLKQVNKEAHHNTNVSIVSFVPYARPFSQEDGDYWGKYGIGENTLRRFNVVPMYSCRFNRSDNTAFQLSARQGDPMYGYMFDQGMKIYRPNNKSRFMYAGRLPHPYVFGWQQLPEKGKSIFITGGEKDVMSLSAHGFNAITFNSETANLPENKISELSRRFENVFIMFDADETGLRESSNRYNELKDGYSNIHRLVLPLPGVKSDKDISDYFRDGNSAADLQSLSDYVLKNDYRDRQEVEHQPRHGISM